MLVWKSFAFIVEMFVLHCKTFNVYLRGNVCNRNASCLQTFYFFIAILRLLKTVLHYNVKYIVYLFSNYNIFRIQLNGISYSCTVYVPLTPKMNHITFDKNCGFKEEENKLVITPNASRMTTRRVLRKHIESEWHTISWKHKSELLCK